MTGAALTWLLCAGELLAYEAFALLTSRELLTDAMRGGLNRWLFFSATWGTLTGHFFGESTLPAAWAWLLVPLGLAVLARDLFIRTAVAPINHLAMCGLFACLGVLLWGSRT